MAGRSNRLSAGCPTPHDLDLDGLDVDHTSVAELLGNRSRGMAKKKLAAHKTFFGLAWRRGPGGIARTMRGARGAL